MFNKNKMASGAVDYAKRQIANKSSGQTDGI